MKNPEDMTRDELIGAVKAYRNMIFMQSGMHSGIRDAIAQSRDGKVTINGLEIRSENR